MRRYALRFPTAGLVSGSLGRALAIAWLVLLLVPAGFGLELAADQGTLFDQGVLALKAGDLDEAESAFRAVIEQGGELAQVHNNLGIVYQMRGQHERAVVEFREAARIAGDYPAPRILLGASLLALGQVEEAKVSLEAAVRLAPGEALAHRQLAKAYERSGEWAGAVDQYRTLRKLAPDEPEHLYGLGQAYLRLSETCLRLLHDGHPDSARSHQAQAHSYRLQGRPDLALEAFERAAQADPTLPEVHLAIAQIHVEQKRWAEAHREIEHERAIVPESAGARALERHLRALEGASR
jgi:tetratricopeptide (TPR) repeat protein